MKPNLPPDDFEASVAALWEALLATPAETTGDRLAVLCSIVTNVCCDSENPNLATLYATETITRCVAYVLERTRKELSS